MLYDPVFYDTELSEYAQDLLAQNFHLYTRYKKKKKCCGL